MDVEINGGTLAKIVEVWALATRLHGQVDRKMTAYLSPLLSSSRHARIILPHVLN